MLHSGPKYFLHLDGRIFPSFKLRQIDGYGIARFDTEKIDNLSY
jgi:hypothetical protein